MEYSGRCHCQAIVFKFHSEVIEAGIQCNCSICIRKNAIMSAEYIQPAQFELIQGEQSLAVYHFGDNDVNHYFCKICGVYPFHDSIYEPGKYRINLGCVDTLEPRNLNISQFDGKHLL